MFRRWTYLPFLTVFYSIPDLNEAPKRTSGGFSGGESHLVLTGEADIIFKGDRPLQRRTERL